MPEGRASGAHGADRVRRIVVAGICAAMLGYMTLTAFSFGIEPRRAPLVVGVPATILAIILVIREVRGTEPVDEPEASVPNFPGSPQEAASADGDERLVAASAGPEPVELTEDRLSTAGAAAWVAALSATFLLFGFLVTTLVFPPVFMRIYGRERWRTIVITTAAVFGATYLFFVVLLEIQVYRGIVTIPLVDAIL